MAFIEPMHRNKPNITYLLNLSGKNGIPAIHLWWRALSYETMNLQRERVHDIKNCKVCDIHSFAGI